MLKVLMSPGKANSSDNQFINLLVKNLDSDINVIDFNWFYALFGTYSVLHIHWQERLYKSLNPLKSRVKQILFRILLVRLNLRKTKVVWTVHNLVPHEGINKIESKLDLKFQESVDVRIYMQPIESESEMMRYIPHGYYELSDKEERNDKEKADQTRIVCAGFLRPSKNLEELIRFFPESNSITLFIVGEPISREYGKRIEALSKAKNNIEVSLGRVSKESMLNIYREADFAIIPYLNTYNSGAAIYALCMPIPLIATESESMKRLQEEVGQGWVQLIRKDFDSPDITTAIERIRCLEFSRSHRPIFSNERQWPKIGEKYSSIYR